jgi:transaldolase
MDAELNPAQRLHALGQSLWLDSINRVMLRTGTLARYVHDLALTGLTSNPTILGHAMAAGSDYDRSLARLAGEGITDAQDLVYALALEDLTEAAALFRPEWERTEGVDGYVSLEVPPDVAYDAAATVALARRLHEQAGFPNLLVKIPGTPQGLTAMEEAITAGIGVNVTLLFSDTHYLRTADAYLRALERRRRAGLDLAVPSVASLFISRWDSAADPLLPPALHGSLGLAMAQKTYASHVQLLLDQRWQALVRSGFCGHPPRPRTQTCPTPTISAGWLPRTRSTPSRRRRCSPSLTTEASTTGWSPTTQPRSGPSQRPPAPVSTPMPSLSISSATEQAHSPRTGPRCSRR